MKKIEFNWDNVSIEQYYNILDILNDEDTNEISKQVSIVSILTKKDEEEIWNMGLTESARYFNALHFLSDFKLKKMLFKPQRIVINNKAYKMPKDLSEMTVSQFFDYQQYVRMDIREGMDKILSIFIIPEDCEKYNDGYDVVEVQNEIRENMPFIKAQSLMGFILTKYIRCVKDTLKYLVKKISRVKETEKKRELMENYQRLREVLEMTIYMGYSAY